MGFRVFCTFNSLSAGFRVFCTFNSSSAGFRVFCTFNSLRAEMFDINKENKGFVQFAVIIKVLVNSFRFI